MIASAAIYPLAIAVPCHTPVPIVPTVVRLAALVIDACVPPVTVAAVPLVLPVTLPVTSPVTSPSKLATNVPTAYPVPLVFTVVVGSA